MHARLLLCLVALLIRTPAMPAEDSPVKPLDASFLRSYAETRGFLSGRPSRPRFSPDNKTILFLRGEARKGRLSLYEYDIAAKTTAELLSPDAVLEGGDENVTPEEKARRERQRISTGGFADYQLSGPHILLSLSGKLYLYHRTTKKVVEVPTGKGTILDPKFSPDGRSISFVRDNDVFRLSVEGFVETRVTTGGTSIVTHGLAEFVAQEEMDRFAGYWWSPDSKAIVWEEADHTGVEVWHVADPLRPDVAPQAQYYPRPGKKNVKVRLAISRLDGGKPVWVEWNREAYEYLAAVKWDATGPLTIQVQDRKQQKLLLLLVDLATGTTSRLLEETDPAWVNLRQDIPIWLAGGKAFLWQTERHGMPVIERYTADGKGQPADIIVPAKDGLVEVISIDESRNEVVFTADIDSSATRVCVRPLSEPKLLKPGSDRPEILTPEAGVSSVVVAPDHSTMIVTRTTLGELPVTTVRDRKGAILGTLPSVAESPGFRPRVEVSKVGEHYASVVLPHGFDAAKKYPVIVDVYGGPHHLHVVQSMRNWLLPQWVADRGFIVVAVENRGTPRRGRDWERAIYQKFGQVPMDDQVAVLKRLGKTHPAMDLDRVGMVGWSFGGYMSALSVLSRPDVFKAAVAGAPVTDWEDYDTHYTERYMGLLPESQAAYAKSSLLPLAAKLSRPLLLIHGTADDNVYFRHSLRLASALIREGRDFEILPLPGLTHMVPDPVIMERMWTRTTGFFRKHLGSPE